ncbi:MAG: hypothetical protein M0Z53_06770 [Thermaerobacter sp.]|nr:hypothetical protein [Thermaerobacter sp.]
MASVTPGPCPSTGCPPPTEIDCIVVDKVYDSCVQTVTLNNECAALAATCIPSTGAAVSCTITSSSCTIGAITPTSTPNYSVVTAVVSVTLSYTVAPATGTVCTASETFTTTTTATLYLPTGTTASCSVVSSACTCVLIPTTTGFNVCCNLSLCVLLESTATVQLLIPTYGFCVPPTCTPSTVTCPPSPLYPPQAS